MARDRLQSPDIAALCFAGCIIFGLMGIFFCSPKPPAKPPTQWLDPCKGGWPDPNLEGGCRYLDPPPKVSAR